MSQDDSISSAAIQWAEPLLEEVVKVTKTSVAQWCNIVAKTGLSESIRNEWSEIFLNQVTHTYKEMIEEAVENQNKIINQIELLLKKAEVLCKDLHIKMPQYGSHGLSLFEEFQLLENRIDEYEQMVATQKKEIQALLRDQTHLCKVLGQQERTISMSPLPSRKTIDEFKRYLEGLESTKFERLETFFNTKNEILLLVNELEYVPDLDFEKTVLAADEEFLITDDNMEKLEMFHRSLIDLQQRTRAEVKHLREVLENLWKILNIDLSVRDSFLSKHIGHNLKTQAALKVEIKRCEILKKANIQTFVEKLREELIHLWDKCNVTELERENFIYFRVDHFTEDLLTLHDYEIQRWENFYKNNKELFTLLEERKRLWNKMLVLEEKETAKDRYKNRGGQLLQEEKERKKLAKDIPLKEERLLELAAKFEQENGVEFLSWGESIQAIINRDHEDHNQNKKLKLSERKKIRDKTLTPFKSNLALTYSQSTQNLAPVTPKYSAVKRKMVTPSCSSKRTKVLREHVTRTVPPKMKLNDKTIVNSSRFSTERAKKEGRRRRLSQRSAKKKSDSSATSEYLSFEREVDSKENCRSTLFGQDLLAVPLAPTPQQTPSSQRSPRIAAKLSMAPVLRLQF